MRAVILGLAGLIVAGDAMAADYLRGSTYEGPPSTGYSWAGIYVGGQVGYTNANMDLSQSTRSLVADMVRALLVETEFNISELLNVRNTDARARAYGGFIGYNSQWGDVVLGLELNYNRTSLTADSSDSIARSFVTSNEFRNDVVLTGNASAHLTDYATLRARAGYAMGWLMPYAMVGLAAGRLDYTRAATVSITETDVSATALDLTDGIAPRAGGSLSDSRTETKRGAITFGYMTGLGVDIGLFPGVFLRGEWEFVQLNPIAGIGLHLNTFRAAAAVKF